jgi:hypothetical protein
MLRACFLAVSIAATAAVRMLGVSAQGAECPTEVAPVSLPIPTGPSDVGTLILAPETLAISLSVREVQAVVPSAKNDCEARGPSREIRWWQRPYGGVEKGVRPIGGIWK